jgi:biopolymer transport protein ExbD
MLLLSAVFIEIRAIEMQRAQAAAAAAEAGLDLAVRITDGAYVIEGRGIAPVSVARSADTAPGAAAGDLTRALAAIAAAHPGERGVRILAGPRVRYEELVALMDAARAAGLPEAALEGTGAEA